MSQQFATYDPTEWGPLTPEWQQFVAANPHLGLGDSRFSANRFARRFYSEMAARGAMTRTRGGRYLAHRKGFQRHAFSVLVEHGESAATDSPAPCFPS